MMLSTDNIIWCPIFFNLQYVCSHLQFSATFCYTQSGIHSVSINTFSLLILDTNITVIQTDNPDLWLAQHHTTSNFSSNETTMLSHDTSCKYTKCGRKLDAAYCCKISWMKQETKGCCTQPYLFWRLVTKHYNIWSSHNSVDVKKGMQSHVN